MTCRRILAVLDEPADHGEGPMDVADGHHVGQLVVDLIARSAEERADRGVVHRVAAEHRCLVEQRQGVPRGPFRLSRDGVGGHRVERDALRLGDRAQVGGEILHGESPEVVPLATPDDGGRHLVGLGGGEHEADPRRRLLEQLQERIERLARQTLCLIDDVDLLPARHGCRGRLLAQVPCIIHTAVGSRVDLDDVDVRALADGDALDARVAGFGGGCPLAVHHLGQDPRGGGLAGSPRPAEQERVMETPLTDRPRQRPDHMVLADEVGRRLRSVPPVEGLMRHDVGRHGDGLRLWVLHLVLRHASSRPHEMAVHPPSTP